MTANTAKTSRCNPFRTPLSTRELSRPGKRCAANYGETEQQNRACRTNIHWRQGITSCGPSWSRDRCRSLLVLRPFAEEQHHSWRSRRSLQNQLPNTEVAKLPRSRPNSRHMSDPSISQVSSRTTARRARRAGFILAARKHCTYSGYRSATVRSSIAGALSSSDSASPHNAPVG